MAQRLREANPENVERWGKSPNTLQVSYPCESVGVSLASRKPGRCLVKHRNYIHNAVRVESLFSTTVCYPGMDAAYGVTAS